MSAGSKSPGLPREIVSDDRPPERVHGYISVQGAGSVFGTPPPAGGPTQPFHADSASRDGAAKILGGVGLQIIAGSPLGFAVVGPPGAYEELSGGKMVARERLCHAGGGMIRYVTHLDLVGTNQPREIGLAFAASPNTGIDGIVIERPRTYHGVFPSPVPPTSPRFHLRLPGDVAIGVGATAAHRKGLHGDGVTVAMPDSGHYRHPYFVSHGYDVKTPIITVPGTDRKKDPIGHGTGESANVFAVAPGSSLQPAAG